MQGPNPNDKLLYSKQHIQQLVAGVALDLHLELDQNYSEEAPMILGILNGGAYFTVDLTRELTIPHQVEFVKTSSYTSNQKLTNTVVHFKHSEVKDRVVVLVDEFLDSGSTLITLGKLFKQAGAKAILVATLLARDVEAIQNVTSSLNAYVAVGDVLENDEWLYGYGLDHGADKTKDYRALQAIYAMSKDL